MSLVSPITRSSCTYLCSPEPRQLHPLPRWWEPYRAAPPIACWKVWTVQWVLPLLSSFASQHNSFHWRRNTGQKDPFWGGWHLYLRTKGLSKEDILPRRGEGPSQQQGQGFLPFCTCWCGTTDLLSTHGPRCSPGQGGNTCMFTMRYLIRTVCLITMTCPCLQDKRNEYWKPSQKEGVSPKGQLEWTPRGRRNSDGQGQERCGFDSAMW